VDVKQVPLWDGETSETPDGSLINRYGGPVMHQGGTKITVSHVTDVVHSGHGAYRAAIAGPVSDFAFFQLALSGLGPTAEYVMSRNIVNTGWTVIGSPDLQQARFIGFVFEATPGLPLNGAVYFDDVVLVEPGSPMNPVTTRLRALVKQIARRQFDGLWGSRSRTHGMIPLNSVFADVGALNSTSAVVKLLPAAYRLGWITQAEADAYITTLVATLNTLMDHATYLPPRYVNWLTLEQHFPREESPVDAAFLALYQYRSLPSTPPSLQTQIDSLLARFNFTAFGSPQGWKLAYLYDSQKFTDGTYDGYSGEIWTISLAAHLMSANQVDITTYYHTGTMRVKDFCAEPRLAHIVHTNRDFRAPFLQWLFPLFVKLDQFPVDNYPIPALATNPLHNAVLYQRDVHRKLAQQGRSLLLQADAGDDGTGAYYQQFSCYNDFERPDLFMPWSVAFSLLAEPSVAVPALRSHLANGLHSPLGLSDSVHWITGKPAPSQITARHDFWNVSLSAMAMSSFLFQDNEFLTSLPEVRAALEKVFQLD